VPAKQSQSKSNKFNPIPVFGPTIGFTAIYFGKAYGKNPRLEIIMSDYLITNFQRLYFERNIL